MSVLEKIIVFVSKEEVMFEFIDSINNILKIENSDDGCEFKTFCLLLKNCFEKTFHSMKKRFSLLGNVLHTARFLSSYAKISFEILLEKIKNIPNSYF